jgi:hypothetical protein
LWACAIVPIWLLPEDDPDGFTEGSFAEKELLRNTFLGEIGRTDDGQEWLEAYEMGGDFRRFMYRLDCVASGWSQKSFARWTEDRSDWARLHPGVPCPIVDDYIFDV